ncbi:hypothetical protein [Rhizobium sp. GCM10022189]|jgi:hypothetical protein|uniref:hypothetical protein n=1 Tax=Rhizobium sp. GCM10022189 TaxID=3252654 RepID=UPI000DD8D8BC
MQKDDVARARKVALVLTLFFGALISCAKFAGLFPPPGVKDEARYGPPGWFSSFDLGPPPFSPPPEFRPVEEPRDISV